MKCLVTGATGFIGRPLSQQLARAGHDLSLTSRSGADVVPGHATVSADLLHASSIGQLCQGVDVVFHLAGIAHQHAVAADYQRLNVDACVALATAARSSGVSTFIYVSSSRATTAGEDANDHYGRSKLEAERALQSLVSDGAMELVIVRPALVYGAPVKGNLALLARAVNAHLPLPPELGQRSMIGVDDLCRLLIRVAEDRASALPVLTVTDGERYSTRRIVAALRAGCSRPVTGMTLPAWCWRAGARMLDLRRGLPGGTHFNKLFGDDLSESNAAEEVRGWAPQQVFEDVASEIMRQSVGPGLAT